MILGGANNILTENSKDGYIINFLNGEFKEIKEPYYFTKTSFFTPGAWVDDNFLVPKPGASGVGELHIGKYDETKGEIEFKEIDYKDYFSELNLNIWLAFEWWW